MYGESLHQMYRRQTEREVGKARGCEVRQLCEDAFLER